MKYNKDDYVLVKNRDEINDVRTPFSFVHGMEQFCGTEHKIIHIEEQSYGGYYTLDGCSNFMWHESWLTDPVPAVQIEEDEIMNIFM